MARLGTLASRLRRAVRSPARERDATARSAGPGGPRAERARAWAGLYLALVDEREDGEEYNA